MTTTHKQNGNALFFILIAIALLGLLTVTLSRSGGNSNDTGDYEQNQIAASEILSYAKSIENAVQQLLARGCSENELSFWNDSDGNGTEDASDDYYNSTSPIDRSCHIFNVAGAGMNSEYPNILFTGDYRITDVATPRSDLLLLLEDIDSLLCSQINILTGAPVIDDGYGTPIKFTGNYPASGSIGGANETLGATSACFLSTSNSKNHFYHVLHVR